MPGDNGTVDRVIVGPRRLKLRSQPIPVVREQRSIERIPIDSRQLGVIEGRQGIAGGRPAFYGFQKLRLSVRRQVD